MGQVIANVLITVIICGMILGLAGTAAFVILSSTDHLKSRGVRKAQDDLEIARANAERDVVEAKREILLDARTSGAKELEAAVEKLRPKERGYNY